MNDESREEKKSEAAQEPLLPKLLKPDDYQDIVVEMAPELAVQKKGNLKESFNN